MKAQGNSEISVARRDITQLKQQLDALYASYQAALKDVPLSFQGEVHKYLCIRLSGFLEQALFIAINGYVRASAGEKAARFALSFWAHAPNLNPLALDKLIARFGDEWVHSLSGLLNEDKRSQLGTLLKVRNDTAHGGNYAGTLPHVSTYKSLVDDLYNWILQVVLA
jgi:hypothetical protein